MHLYGDLINEIWNFLFSLEIKTVNQKSPSKICIICLSCFLELLLSYNRNSVTHFNDKFLGYKTTKSDNFSISPEFENPVINKKEYKCPNKPTSKE